MAIPKHELKSTKTNRRDADRLLEYMRDGSFAGKGNYIYRKSRRAVQTKAYWFGVRMGLKMLNSAAAKLERDGFPDSSVVEAYKLIILASRRGERLARVPLPK